MWLNIDILNIHETFGTQTILPDVSLRIDGGSVMVILEPSGSGKTKFLRCLNALERSERGQLRFPDLTIDFAAAPSKADILRLLRKTGIVFQHYNLKNNLKTMNY